MASVLIWLMFQMAMLTAHGASQDVASTTLTTTKETSTTSLSTSTISATTAQSSSSSQSTTTASITLTSASTSISAATTPTSAPISDQSAGRTLPTGAVAVVVTCVTLVVIIGIGLAWLRGRRNQKSRQSLDEFADMESKDGTVISTLHVPAEEMAPVELPGDEPARASKRASTATNSLPTFIKAET